MTVGSSVVLLADRAPNYFWSNSGGFDWVEVLVSAGVGFVVGVFVYLLTDASRRPNLVFTPQSGNIDGKPYRFLHVLVSNERRSYAFRWRDRTANYPDPAVSD